MCDRVISVISVQPFWQAKVIAIIDCITQAEQDNDNMWLYDATNTHKFTQGAWAADEPAVRLILVRRASDGSAAPL